MPDLPCERDPRVEGRASGLTRGRRFPMQGAMRTALAALTVLTACLLAAPAMAKGSGYSAAEVEAKAKELAKELDMPVSSRDVVLGRLKGLLQEGDFKAKMKKAPVTGIFAYQMGEGGFIVKVKEGKGRICFNAEGKNLDLTMEATTVGAQIGGSSQWGVGLVMGLEDPTEFGGKYEGENYNATAGTAGVITSQLIPKGASEPHKVVLLGTAKGLSAGASGEWLQIAVDR
jgi:hypothetical protein